MKKIIVIILMTVIGFGCSDFLEPKQTNITYNEVFWKSQKDAETGLIGVYSLYRALMVDSKNWFQRGDATTGFFNKGWNGGSPDALYKQGDFSSPSSTIRSWGGLQDYSDWSLFYKVIAHANLTIAKIEQMSGDLFTADKKEQFLGEAYFLRALVYFNILKIWGNAPYIAESIESSSQVINNDLTPIQIPRTKDVDIAKYVLNDASKAVNLLKYQTPFTDGWGIRANKGSAEALAGHVNMWMYFLANRDNLPNPSQYLTGAITALESLQTDGGYALEDYSKPDILKVLYENVSLESVFQLNVSSSNNESYRIDHGGIEYFTIKVNPLDGDITKDRASNINFIPYAQKTLIYPEFDFTTESGDIRPKIFFDSWTSIYNDPFSDISQTATDRTLVTWMKKYGTSSVDAFRKWDEYTAYFAEADIPIFRFTDLYLLLAEAYVKSGQEGKAKVIVEDIRARAGLGEYSGNNLLKEVLQQRFSELIGEGQIFYDMVRNNYFPNAQVMEPERYAQQGYYWPVSPNILLSNKKVSQTPYWNGKTTW